jgi:hypothetical protein
MSSPLSLYILASLIQSPFPSICIPPCFLTFPTSLPRLLHFLYRLPVATRIPSSDAKRIQQNPSSAISTGCTIPDLPPLLSILLALNKCDNGQILLNTAMTHRLSYISLLARHQTPTSRLADMDTMLQTAQVDTLPIASIAPFAFLNQAILRASATAPHRGLIHRSHIQ